MRTNAKRNSNSLFSLPTLNKQAKALMAAVLISSPFAAATAESASESVPTPSPLEVSKVVNFYYNGGDAAPLLVGMKLCDDIHLQGDEKNNCANEISSQELNTETTPYLWFNFLVPSGSEHNILVQMNHGGLTRDTRSFSVHGSVRYRIWKKVRFPKAGQWDIVVLQDGDNGIQELYKTQLNIPTMEAVTYTGQEDEMNISAASDISEIGY